MLSYEGIFFDSESVAKIHSLEKERLPLVNDEIHCTFKYHPQEDEIFDELVGQEIEVLITGYGNNGKNSGFILQLPETIMPYYINFEDEEHKIISHPHITASLAEGAKASDTRFLEFELLPQPVRVKGKFGYWIKEENLEYVSFQKYKKEKTVK